MTTETTYTMTFEQLKATLSKTAYVALASAFREDPEGRCRSNVEIWMPETYKYKILFTSRKSQWFENYVLLKKDLEFFILNMHNSVFNSVTITLQAWQLSFLDSMYESDIENGKIVYEV